MRESIALLLWVCSMVKFPGMRPTAEVVAILNKTPRRAQVVGILTAEGFGDVLRLTPCDPRMPHMMVNASSIPAGIQQGLLVYPSLFFSCPFVRAQRILPLLCIMHSWAAVLLVT